MYCSTRKNKIVIKDLTALLILIKTSFYWLYVGLGRQIYLSNSQARAGGTVQHEQREFLEIKCMRLFRRRLGACLLDPT